MGKLAMFNNVLPLTGRRTILESLQIGRPGAKVTKACILEGELVAYDDSVCFYDPFLILQVLTFTSYRKYYHFIKFGSMCQEEGAF